MSSAFWWCITGLALAGAFLNARAKWQGFVCWIVANVALGIKAGVRADWPQVALWTLYTIISILGIVTWRQKGAGN